MSLLVAATWVGPGIPAAADVAQAWMAWVGRSYHWLEGNPSPSLAAAEAQLQHLWQQISRLHQEGGAEPLLVIRGSLADPIGAGQTWADLAGAWHFPVLLMLPRRGALSQAAAFAALLQQAQARCVGWVLVGEPELDFATGSPPFSPPPEQGQTQDLTLAAYLETQLGIPVLGYADPEGQITWDGDALAALGYV